MLDEEQQTRFSNSGVPIVLPDVAEFESRCQLWNSMIDRRPIAIAACKNKRDVQNAVKIAKTLGLKICIKGGGHNIAGAAMASGALMIDLSDMRDVVVDPEARVAYVQGGAMLADVDRATQVHNLAVPLGIASETGVGGLALGGGMGWLSRQFGLTCDNLLAAEIILADGTVTRVEPNTHPDLFWALQGGGGGLGVVTQFEFRLHPVGPKVLFGPTVFALEDGHKALQLWGAFLKSASHHATIWVDIAMAPLAPFLPPHVHGTPVVVLLQCWAGNIDEGADALAAIQEHPDALGSWVTQRSFVEAQQFIDEAYAKGARNYWSPSAHVALTDELITRLLDIGATLPSKESDILLCGLGGAIDDVAPDATAYPHRGTRIMAVPGARFHDEAQDETMIAWAKQAGASLAALGSSAAYVNFISESGGRCADAFGTNQARLKQIKTRYDPDSMFLGTRDSLRAADN